MHMASHVLGCFAFVKVKVKVYNKQCSIGIVFQLSTCTPFGVFENLCRLLNLPCVSIFTKGKGSPPQISSFQRFNVTKGSNQRRNSKSLSCFCSSCLSLNVPFAFKLQKVPAQKKKFKNISNPLNVPLAFQFSTGPRKNRKLKISQCSIRLLNFNRTQQKKTQNLSKSLNVPLAF